MASSLTAADVQKKLQEALAATDVTVNDISGGCGSSFEVHVTSAAFEGKTLLQRHRLVNDALKAEMEHIHALTIKRCHTPEQAAKAAAQ